MHSPLLIVFFLISLNVNISLQGMWSFDFKSTKIHQGWCEGFQNPIMSLYFWNEDDPLTIQQECIDVGEFDGSTQGLQSTIEISKDLFESVFSFEGGYLVGMSSNNQVVFYGVDNSVFSWGEFPVSKILFCSASQYQDDASLAYPILVVELQNGSRVMLKELQGNFGIIFIDEYVLDEIFVVQFVSLYSLSIISRNSSGPSNLLRVTAYNSVDYHKQYQVAFSTISVNESIPWVAPCAIFLESVFSANQQEVDGSTYSMTCNGKSSDGLFFALVLGYVSHAPFFQIEFYKTPVGPNQMSIGYTVPGDAQNVSIFTIDANSGNGVQLKFPSEDYSVYSHIVNVSFLSGPMNVVYVDSHTAWAASNESMTIFSAPVTPYWCGIQDTYEGDTTYDLNPQLIEPSQNFTTFSIETFVPVSLLGNFSKNYTGSSFVDYWVCTECEAYSPMETSECSGHGECIMTFENAYYPRCACNLGWTGVECNEFRSDYTILAIALFSSLLSIFLIFGIGTICNKRAETTPESSVLSSERQDVGVRRENYGIDKNAPLFGLACSGGGIRSAAFQSGILRAIDETVGLHSVDFVSSVSGGGYICSSLFTHVHERNEQLSNSNDISEKRKILSESLRAAIRQMLDSPSYFCRFPDEMNFLRFLELILDFGFLVYVILFSIVLLFIQLLVLVVPMSFSFGYLQKEALNNAIMQTKTATNDGVGQFEGLSYLLMTGGIRPLLSCLILMALWIFVMFIRKIYAFMISSKGAFLKWTRRVARGLEVALQVLSTLVGAGLFWFMFSATAVDVQEDLKIGVTTQSLSMLFVLLISVVVILLVLIWSCGLSSEHFVGKFLGWGILFLEAVLFCGVFIEAEPAYDYIKPFAEPGVMIGVFIASLIFVIGFDFLREIMHQFYRHHLASRFYSKKHTDLKLYEVPTSFAPYYLCCTTLNGVRFDERTKREFHSFVLSPKFCGNKQLGYRESETKYAYFHLSTAMAISGAAMAYALGYLHQSRRDLHVLSSSFLGLGWGKWFDWHDKLFKIGRFQISWPRVLEILLFGSIFTVSYLGIIWHLELIQQSTTSEPSDTYWVWATCGASVLLFVLVMGVIVPSLGFYSPLVRVFHQMHGIAVLIHSKFDVPPALYLGDGGHSENLGLYELLKRRCAKIIVGNAEEEPSRAAESLSKAVRQAIQEGYVRSASVRIEGNTMVSLDSYLETEWKENPESLIVEIIYHKQHSIQQPEVKKLSDDYDESDGGDLERTTLLSKTHELESSNLPSPSNSGQILYLQPTKNASKTMSDYRLQASGTEDEDIEFEENEYGWCSWFRFLPKQICGVFPFHSTGNQFFNKKLFGNYHLLGHKMTVNSIRTLFKKESETKQ